MSIWDFIDEVKAETTGTAEISVSFEVIPDGSTVLAQVVSAKWKKAFEREEQYLEVQWEVLEPAALSGRKFFNKHWIKDEDSSQKDAEKRAKKLKNAFGLFANIDHNAGGKIVNYMIQKKDWPVEDNINIALANKPMLIHVKEWAMGDNKGNWISAVWAKGAKETAVGKGSAPKPAGGFGSAAADPWGSAGGFANGGGDILVQTAKIRLGVDDSDIPF